jgi:hypothetical protein
MVNTPAVLLEIQEMRTSRPDSRCLARSLPSVMDRLDPAIRPDLRGWRTASPAVGIRPSHPFVMAVPEPDPKQHEREGTGHV